MTSAPQHVDAALVPPMRRRVLETLVQSTEPVDAHAIATQLDLHITTARFHLEQLEQAGLARRHPDTEKRRGRPRILYRPSGPARDEGTREQLISVLASALASRSPDERRAEQAGAEWAAAFPATGRDARGELGEILERLGFEPEATDRGISLYGCPFREAAREHPEVVCSVHRGLIGQIVERSGSGVHATLLPMIEPELCLIELSAPGN